MVEAFSRLLYAASTHALRERSGESQEKPAPQVPFSQLAADRQRHFRAMAAFLLERITPVPRNGAIAHVLYQREEPPPAKKPVDTTGEPRPRRDPTEQLEPKEAGLWPPGRRAPAGGPLRSAVERRSRRETTVGRRWGRGEATVKPRAAAVGPRRRHGEGTVKTPWARSKTAQKAAWGRQTTAPGPWRAVARPGPHGAITVPYGFRPGYRPGG